MTKVPLRTRDGDWLIYAAFLPALLTLSAIGVTAVASRDQALWNSPTRIEVRIDADDYVQGLARLGIAKLPAYRPASPVEEISAVVANQ
jgi:hypothetical protein